jgi:hypothetical protein
MNLRLLTMLAACLFAQTISAEEMVYRAVRAAGPPIVDGDLSDPAWRDAPEISGFIQRDPDDGQPATERTVVRVVYDDHAVYFGARLYDSQPVRSRLGRRDTTIESDWFRVYIDPHLDRRSGATFQVNPANVQYDAVLYSDSVSDANWDAVWSSATRVDADGWTVEMRIPYSQLRFPQRPAHTWGIQITRLLSRRNELSALVHIPRGSAGYVSRFANLGGIEGIRSGRALEILPYAVARVDRDRRAGAERDRRAADAGVDVKYGLTSNLTLTGTLNPDFGQVEVDPARVNLTQFELFFPEKRPFFVEGASLFAADVVADHVFSFNFTQPSLFYSRRVGRVPQGTAFFDVPAPPEQTTILGAAKITGKTANGWTVAVLDALTAEEEASGITLEPLTNHAVMRVARDLGEKSAAGFRVTSVQRRLPGELQPFLRGGATSAAVDGYRIFGDNDYVLQWFAGATHVTGTPEAILRTQRAPARYYQRPDAGHVEVDGGRTSLTGSGGRALFAKHSGKWQYNLQAEGYTPGFESNDAGFMVRSDIISTHAVGLYINQDPWRMTRRRTFWMGKFQHWNLDGDLIQNGLWYDGAVVFNNYWQFLYWGGTEASTIDDRITRGGPAIRVPQRSWVGGAFTSDSRKPLYLTASGEVLRDERDGFADVLALGITYRPTSRLSLRLSPAYYSTRSTQQYVATVLDAEATHTFGSRYVFADIERKTLDVGVRLDWTFTSRLSLQLYMQPYVATGAYSAFKEVARPRSLDFRRYEAIAHDPSTDRYTVDPDGGGPAAAFSFGNPDFNYRSLRGNAVLRWEFRPGSALYAVWNESREDELPFGDFRVRRDLRGTIDSPSRDVFLVKMSWWVGG